MKRTLVLCLLLVAVFLAFPISARADAEKSNPIEKAFASDFKEASNTVEINYVSEKYLNAWQEEFANIAAVIKKSYKFAEDRKRVDEYAATVKKLGKIAFDLEMLNWLDTSQAPGERSFGTGGPGAAMGAEARIYKQGTLNLISHYNTVDDSRKYKYLYKGKGARLDKLRKENQ